MNGVLVDTMIWGPGIRLRKLVSDGLAHLHPYVLCELALGARPPVDERVLFGLMEGLRRAPLVSPQQTLALIERERLARTGIGYVDAALLASARQGGLRIWTRDRPLRAVAARLRLLHNAD